MLLIGTSEGKHPMSITSTETKYFQIIGGSTVLQLDDNEWTRWDLSDGLIRTHINWDESSSQLKRITKEEAINLMK